MKGRDDLCFDARFKQNLERPERYQELQPDRLLVKMSLGSGEGVVDLGCGTGFFAIAAAHIIGKGGQVLAVDANLEMLEEVKKRCLEEGLTNIETIQADVLATGLLSGQADVVILAHILHEVEDKIALLQESARLLRLGGRAFIVDYDKKERPASDSLYDVGPPLHIRVAREELPSLVERAGLRLTALIDVPPVRYAAVCRKGTSKPK
ncbi:MAG: class I SAM-dependent methyltransferase [Chloroflexi bacterium]|nr:class I SAM-dependent methyltransferase [Chloroflexota bacterium]MCL5075095.1 class I SAM-dependent methyltransferase [Chloroflexota bacterium]